MLTGLVEGSHTLAPDDVPAAIRGHAAEAGFADAVVYLADVQQDVLVEFSPPEQGASSSVLHVEDSTAGRAYWSSTIIGEQGASAESRDWLWVPIVDGVERLGVLRLACDQATDDVLQASRWLGSLVALVLVSKRPFNDTAARAARTREMTLAAEVQWALLPPLTFATDSLVITGALEPAYEIGGDAFDYGTAGPLAYLAVFDAMGHDLSAGLTASIAIGAWRHARRRGLDLDDASIEIDQAVAAQFDRRRFITGILATLDARTGELRWINRGHPAPLLLRGGALAKSLDGHTAPPMGFRVPADPRINVDHIQPDDRLLFYTDGITEARNPAGQAFGIERFTDFIIRHNARGLSAPETLRRLVHAVLHHQGGRLQDDASILLVEWCPRHLESEAGLPT